MYFPLGENSPQTDLPLGRLLTKRGTCIVAGRDLARDLRSLLDGIQDGLLRLVNGLLLLLHLGVLLLGNMHSGG
eukprot:CAMPEP_0119064724 /NCGR_PEP_ID=MMETSP1178-20130426/7725_1 /TAXON_ID=33656 /ORGANISM="unid sp, Strain CCMP2000" /LENGTH=73 /DNA_ID=CAMNT_0007046181 /DNA_START=50 /DNA_END=268 /DNA_ORIENTATION=+